MAHWPRIFLFTWLALTSGLLWSAPGPQCGATTPAAASTPRININTATVDQLSGGLKGIGKAKAAAIVEWRQTNGAFASLADLDEVKGIGPAILDKNKDLIIFRDD